MQYLTVGIAKDEPKAVVIAAFSGRLSRMYLWDTETDEFNPGQFLKGRAIVLDISPDAKYVVYQADKFHKKEQQFLAISHPPYFSAVGFFPVHFTKGFHAHFEDPKTLKLSAERKDLGFFVDGYDKILERIEPNCPLKIIREKAKMSQPDTTKLVFDVRRNRYIKAENMTLYESEREEGPWKEMKTFHKEEFEEIDPPEWALQW